MDDLIQPFKAEDTISFTVQISPQATTTELTGVSPSTGQGTNDTSTTQDGAFTGTVGANNTVPTQSSTEADDPADTLTAIKYNVVITLKTATEATEQEG